MKFKLNIDSENQECQTRYDLVNIIGILIEKIADTQDNCGIIRDINGNRVGKWELELDQNEEE